MSKNLFLDDVKNMIATREVWIPLAVMGSLFLIAILAGIASHFRRASKSDRPEHTSDKS